MPEIELSDEQVTLRNRALLAVERALREQLGNSLTRLDSAEVQSEYSSRGFTDGWRFSAIFSDGLVRRLDILVTRSFPYLSPRAALVDRPEYLTWPHVEHDGTLCLLTNLSEVDQNDPGSVALNIVNRAVRLVEELIDGRIVGRDFREEFLTYWFYGASDSTRDVVTLFDPPEESRLLRSFHHDDIIFVAETDDDLTSWIRNRFGSNAARRVRNHTEPVAYVWLSAPPLPSEYPKDGAEVLALARNQDEQAATLVAEAALHDDAKYLCLFAARGRGGAGIVPVHIDRSSTKRDRFGRNNDKIFPGFRPGKLPDSIKHSKTFGSVLVRRAQVARADGPWIHGRGKDPRSRLLLEKSVTILGCGSVGSFVAQDLALSGVGTLNLVDYEDLAWANLGRHGLGANSVGRNKALALADRLQQEYPHLNVKGYDRSATTIIYDDPSELLNADLIVSAMGSWAAESVLNQWHNHYRRLRPIVYGWTENHALAGSAVTISKYGGCLACGLNRVGAPLDPVINWSDEQMLSTEPSCADHYRPYGAVELAGTTNLVSRTALDELLKSSDTSYRNIWIGQLDAVEALGGSINPQVADRIQGSIVGFQAYSLSWPAQNCPIDACKCVSRNAA